MFEDYAPLSPESKHATALLRSGEYAKALESFRAIQDQNPSDPIAFRGEVHAAYRLDTLKDTISRFELKLIKTKAGGRRLAVAQYALGDAIMASRTTKGYPGEVANDLGPEPKKYFWEAIKTDENLLVAHLALAAYYEHGSQQNGTAARKLYQQAKGIRPDLASKLRYLHALTWIRPGFVTPNEIARLRRRGLDLPQDRQKMPEKTIAECKLLLVDYPDFLPAYEKIAECYEWPIGNKAAADKYRKLAAQVRAKAATKTVKPVTGS